MKTKITTFIVMIAVFVMVATSCNKDRIDCKEKSTAKLEELYISFLNKKDKKSCQKLQKYVTDVLKICSERAGNEDLIKELEGINLDCDNLDD